MMAEEEKTVDGGGGEKAEAKTCVKSGSKEAKKEEELEDECSLMLNTEVDGQFLCLFDPFYVSVINFCNKISSCKKMSVFI